MGATLLAASAPHLGAVSATHMGAGEAIIFWILGPISVLGALGMVLSKNAIHSALWLVATMFSLGVFYVMEQGPFIGFVQIIVYTGAIMILFLFVLMLVGRDSSDSVVESLRGQRPAAILLGLGLGALLVATLGAAMRGRDAVGLQSANGQGNIEGIAKLLFHNYIFAFEATSALLITAAVGAMVLAHVERGPDDRPSQRQVVRARFRSGTYAGPKPGPGVFATNDSIATPALLPDGSVAPTSITDTAREDAAEAEERRRRTEAGERSQGNLERSQP